VLSIYGFEKLKFREKKHRLPSEYYTGEVSVAFTLCLRGSGCFVENEFKETCVDALHIITAQYKCMVPVYCFMPDHQHIILTGTTPDSNVMKAIIAYKQRTGFWLSKHINGIRWQKDFYDHVIRSNENIKTQVRYVLDNPVRKGIVPNWQEYPHTGSVSCSLDDILAGVI